MNDAEGHKSQPPDSRLRQPLPPGTRVDHYVIQSVLGAGGFGITYLAEHDVLGKRYAIKEYFPQAFSFREGRSVRPSTESSPTYQWGLERFVTEARALARFKHPSIVDVASIFEANDTAYIVLAYERGRDMSDWLRSLGRPPTQAEMDKIVEPLLSALEEIHRHKLLHRDIAPDNILIREDGSPVLIDFGSARESVRGRSRAVSMIVKHGYSPPEQYSSNPELQGPWTDIYAFAATLYRAVAGRTPPEATDRLLKDDIPHVSKVAKGAFRPTFLDAIERGLRIRTEERPRSVDDWREQLLKQESVRVGAPSRTSVPRRSEPPRSSLPRASQRTSARFSQRRSHSPSQRPDLSVLDQEIEASAPEPAPSFLENPGARIMAFTGLGLVGGAICGALFSIIPASIFAASCFADSCIASYLPACTAIGALAGAAVGFRIGQMPPSKEAGAQRPDQL